MTIEEAKQLAIDPFDQNRFNQYKVAHQVLYNTPYVDTCQCGQVSDLYNKLIVAVIDMTKENEQE